MGLIAKARQAITDLRAISRELDAFWEAEQYTRQLRNQQTTPPPTTTTDCRLGEMLHPDDRADEGRW